MTVDATQSFEIAARNTRFHVEYGGILRFIDRVGVDNGTRFDVEIDDGGYAELRGVRNYNETEGFVSIINHGLLELTKSTTSVRPQPPGFLSTDENQFTPTDLINDGTIRVIGDQTPDTVTKLQFNATITNYVGGGVALAQGRWELLGAPIEYHNTPDIAEFLENTGIAIINTNVTDVMWSDRIVNDVGLDYTAPNTELWYNDAEVVFSGAARWDYFDTLRENRNVLEFRDHHHFHTVGDFANSGELTVDNDSELDNNGTFTNHGGTAVFSGASTLGATGGVVVEGGLVRIEADSLVNGVTFEGESGALLPADTTWVVRDVFDPGDPDNGIPATVQPAALEIAGRRVLLNFGNVALEGEQASFEAVQSLEINAGPLLVSAGNHLTITPENEDGVLQPVLINDGIGSGFYGRLEVATGGSLTVDAVDGIESWAGDVIVGGGSYLFAPKVNFLAELNGQPLPFPGSFHVDGEAATDLVNIAPHITLSGDGIIRGLSGADTMVMVDGTLSPGSSTGSLEIQGDYSQTANADMLFEVSGFGDTSADQLLVSGEAMLDGVLDLSIVDGYGLEAGQQFTIVSAGELVNNGLALTGSGSSHFAITIHPGIDGFVQIEYLGGSFILPGDYNGDHVVDAADYTVWRNHLGEAITLPNEDPNTTPGLVTQEDYEIWRSYYGESSSSTNGVGAVNVPEPAAALILLIGLATMLVGRRSLV